MLNIHRLEKIYFSPNKLVIVDYILKQAVRIKTMTISHIAKETFKSASLLIGIAKKLKIFTTKRI